MLEPRARSAHAEPCRARLQFRDGVCLGEGARCEINGPLSLAFPCHFTSSGVKSVAAARRHLLGGMPATARLPITTNPFRPREFRARNSHRPEITVAAKE